MNNKQKLYDKYLSKLSKLNNGNSSLSELNLPVNDKELFNNFKNKESSKTKNNNFSIIQDRQLKENDLLNISKKDKNRIIRQMKEKEKDNYLYGNYIKIIKPCKCGNVYCFLYINNYPLFTIGPQYYYPIILFIFNNTLFILAFIYVYNKYNSYFFKIMGVFVLIIVNLSQIYTCVLNEGIPKRIWFLSNKIINYLIEDEIFYNEFNTNKYQICRKCNILIDKSLKIVHCDICNLCCEFYDHHCPWVGKCIGKNNILSFKIFILSNLIFIFYNIILSIILFIIKYNK